MEGTKKKKKIDYEALNSAFMRIPSMDVQAARALLDLGFQDVFELQGISPEWIYEQYTKKKNKPSRRILFALRLATYVAETETPEQQKLKLEAWAD